MKLIDEATRIALEELGAIVTGQAGRYESVHLPEAGTVTIITEIEANQKLQAAIVKRLIEVARLASQIGKISSDQNLSDQGKRNLRSTLDGDRRKLAGRLEADATEVDNMLWLAQETQRQLYAPPEITLGDFATALGDAEIRTWVAGQSPEQLVAVVAQMSSRQIQAMVRSPVPLADSMSKIIEAKWEQHLKTDKARELKEAQDDLDNAKFGTESIKQLSDAVSRLAYHDADAAMTIRPYEEEVAQ